MTKEYGFLEISSKGPDCEMEFSNFVSIPFDELLIEYPQMSSIPDVFKKLPFAGVFRVTWLPVSGWQELDDALMQEGFDLELAKQRGYEKSKEYEIRRYSIYANLKSKYIKQQHGQVTQKDIESIACWFLRRDFLYPDLVRDQVNYWRNSERLKKYVQNGELKVDGSKLDFWDIHDQFYWNNLRQPLGAFPMGGGENRKVITRIVEYYLKLALAEMEGIENE